MYAIYRELHPPTGVEHCTECHFFNQKQKSLVVAAASVLKVYDLCCVRPGMVHDECKYNCVYVMWVGGTYSTVYRGRVYWHML